MSLSFRDKNLDTLPLYQSDIKTRYLKQLNKIKVLLNLRKHGMTTLINQKKKYGDIFRNIILEIMPSFTTNTVKGSVCYRPTSLGQIFGKDKVIEAIAKNYEFLKKSSMCRGKRCMDQWIQQCH